MTWDYSGDPATSELDAVRYHVGDTDTDDQMVTNEEIEYVLGRSSGGVVLASIEVLQLAASKYARLVSTASGDIRVSLQQRSDGLRAQADALRVQYQRHEGVPTPYAGGLSLDEIETDADNADLVQPRFFRNQFRDSRRSRDDSESRRNSRYYDRY